MSECPKSDAGHEPLHVATKSYAARLLPGSMGPEDIGSYTPERFALMNVSVDPEAIDGPSGKVNVCKHCRLLYFTAGA